MTDEDAVGENPASRAGWLRSRWLLALIAGLLGALLMLVIGLGSGLFSGSVEPSGAGPTASPSGPPPSTSAPPSEPPVTVSPPVASPTPSPWPGEPDGTVYIVGNVELDVCRTGCTRFFDLDQNQGSVIAGQPETDVSATPDGLGMQNQAQVAAWGRRDEPTLADCRGIPDEQWLVPHIEADSFQEPASFCVRTDRGRYGYLQPQPGGSAAYHFYYVLWTQPDDA